MSTRVAKTWKRTSPVAGLYGPARSFSPRSTAWLDASQFTRACQIHFINPWRGKYECFPALKFLYPDQSNYIAVEKLPEGDVKSIIDSWFKEKHRTLTTYQMDLLMRSFDQCPLPLNLKLSFDEACRWTSFAAQDTTRLQTTIRASINRLFFRLERQHGELFVSRTLGYITAGV